MANSQFDVILGDISSLQGYRAKTYMRDSAPQVSSKFSTGQQGQTDLDLLKSASIDTLAGGMFQRIHTDPTKSARQVGIFNPFDENTYPTVPASTPSGTLSYGAVTAKVESESYSFIIYNQTSGGFSYNYLNKTVGNTVTNITMPAALHSIAGTVRISSMWLHKGYLFVAASPAGFTAANCYRYDIAANTWQDITGNGSIFITMRGNLYLINSSGAIYTVTNETAAGAATYTQVGQVGGTDIAPISAAEFNGAAWITKPDGFYRFDAISVIKVLWLKASFLTVWNGAMYFMVGNWLYSFNGAQVVKVQYFNDVIYGISSNSEYLFLQTWITTASFDTPKVSSGSGFVRLYAYNGVGFTIICEKDITIETSIQHGLIYSSSYLMYLQPNVGVTTWDANYGFSINLANLFSSAAVTSASALDITTSEFDDGFPNIYKSLAAIEVNYSGMTNGDIITVKYQMHDGKAWGSWQTAGTLSFSSTSPYIEVLDPSPHLFKRMKINAYASTLTSGSTLSIKGVSWRYTLQPRHRWRWQTTLLASSPAVLADRNNTAFTSKANALTLAVTRSLRQKTPLFMFSPDYGIVKTGISAAALSFIVKGQPPIETDPYLDYPLCAVKNSNGVWEVLRVSGVSYNSGANETTITVLERGYYGVTAATISANAEFHLANKVYVTRLLRDQLILDDTTYDEQVASGESQMQREMMVEITEI